MARAHCRSRRATAADIAVARGRVARARDRRAHPPAAARTQSRQRTSAGDGAPRLPLGRLGDQGAARRPPPRGLSLLRSEEHTSEFQSLLRISYAVFCLKKKQQFNIFYDINLT